MALSVVIHSKSEAGEPIEIAIEKTGGDKGKIRFKSWQAGQDPVHNAPSTDKSVDLYDIRARSPLEIICKGSVFIGSHPDITCTLHDAAPPGGPLVQVDIEGAWAGNGTTKYPVTQPDFTKLKQFLAAAHFPPENG